MAIFSDFLNQLVTGDNLRDYQHASRTFVNSLYRLAPKYSSLFHVFIELDREVSRIDTQQQVEMGLMAKSVTLPKFSVQTKTYNAYNRKNVAQERINYDPITMVFHDDSANVVRNFWYDYYSYYYRDSDHSEALYHTVHKYDTRQQQSWGYTPRMSTATGSPNFIKSIRIYSLHQKSFSSYILLRPTITTFSHGQHTQDNYETLEHSMTFAYEAVQYEYGPVSQGTVMGWQMMHYDTTPSPLTVLGGGTTSILGPGGLADVIGTTATNLQNGNYGVAALGLLRGASTFKGADLSTIAVNEASQIAKDIIRGQNTQATIFVPTINSVSSSVSKAVTSIPGLTGGTNTIRNMNNQTNLATGIFGGTF